MSRPPAVHYCIVGKKTYDIRTVNNCSLESGKAGQARRFYFRINRIHNTSVSLDTLLVVRPEVAMRVFAWLECRILQ